MKFLSALFALSLPLPAQASAPGDRVADLAFPAFCHGDGRQKLSQFVGQPVLVVTFSDVWGGTAAADRAFKLHDQYGKDGLVVILTHTEGGGTYADGASKVDLGAWLLKRYPGRAVRICGTVRPTWNWGDLGMPPYWAVIGADGLLVGRGDLGKGPKVLDEAVKAAMQKKAAGWGPQAEAAVRAQLYGRGTLAAARAAATGALVDEVEAAFQRRCAIVEWLLADGQWSRAKAEGEALRASASGVAGWQDAVDALMATWTSTTGVAELDLDGKLEKLCRPLQKGPTAEVGKRLREFAGKHDGTSVGQRSRRLAEQVEQALMIQ